MIKWLAALIIVLLLSICGYFYYDIQYGPGSQPPPVLPQGPYTPNIIRVTHAFKDGEHRFVGDFKLPHSCYSVDTEALYDGKTIQFRFATVDKSDTRSPCIHIFTSYSFSNIVEAPEDAPAEFIIDGVAVPATMRETDWQSAAGTIIDSSVNAGNK